jgi:hypothetical protein
MNTNNQTLHLDCRKWEKGRATQLTFDPRIGYIDTICVDFQEDFMMAASEEQGKTRKWKEIAKNTKCL